MSNKDSMLSVVLRKTKDKLIYTNGGDEALYKIFLNGLEEGHSVQVFFDANMDDGTLAQLAKIKACIRELAKESGNTFDDMQLEIKKASGLCVVKEIEGERYIICKSFANCSKEDLGLAIQTIIQKGDFLNMNLR